MGHFGCLRYRNKRNVKCQQYACNDIFWLAKGPRGNPALLFLQRKPIFGGLIYCKAEKLQSNGHSIVFRWIQDHSGFIGNEKVDLAAKNRAERGGKQVERWSSLAYFKKNLTQAQSKVLTKWHELKMQEREVSRHGFYVLSTKAEINPILANAPKK